jgi:PmbA protein
VGDLLDLASGLAARAEEGEQIEAVVSRGRSTNVKAYDGEVEAFTSAETFAVGVRVVRDHRQGFASAGSLDEAVLIDILDEARDNAQYGEPDEWYGLAEPDGVDPVEIDLWRPALAAFPTDRKIELAMSLERAARNGDPRIVGVRQATYGDSAGEAAIATSTGIATWSRATACHLSVSALAADGEATQIGGGVDVAREPAELSIERAAGDAVERATRLIGATKPLTQRLTIVLEPRLAATLIGIAGGMLTGDVVLKGRSPFADRIGERIASELLTFVDDPTDPRSFAADSEDGEGLATRRNALVVDGVLQGFLHDTYTGRRSGGVSTGSAVRGARSMPSPGLQALAIQPRRGTLDELVSGVDNGLLVQSFNGLHSGVNAVSGDFSVGTEGLMIRDGALAEPVREATIASTLQRLLLDISAVGADVEWLPGGTAAVTLVIPDVALSGR